MSAGGVPTKTETTFAELTKGRAGEYPILARAVADAVPAESGEIEWAVPGGTWRNYTQIFRYPYSRPTPEGSAHVGGDNTTARALHQFLSAIEHTLIWGIPDRMKNPPLSMCGGYRHFLDRELDDGDSLILRPLREPFLWTHTWDYRENVPLDTPTYEWLAEVSLQINPAA